MRRLVTLATATVLLPTMALAADAEKGYWEYRFTDFATNLAALALVIFLGIVWIVGGFKFAGKSLDKRSENIRNELEEARRLRDEAQKLLSDTERRQREAEAEASAIIEQAKKDASRMMSDAEAELKERLTRRTALAADRIARAEAEAAENVRRAAADAATEAAERILSEKAGAMADDQFERAAKSIEKALS